MARPLTSRPILSRCQEVRRHRHTRCPAPSAPHGARMGQAMRRQDARSCASVARSIVAVARNSLQIAWIVAGEAVEAQTRHQADHVPSHRALGIGRVVGRRGRLAAGAIAAQAGADDRKLLRQRRRNAMPHQVRLGKAVQQPQRPPRPLAPGKDRCLPDIDLAGLESVEHAVWLARASVACARSLATGTRTGARPAGRPARPDRGQRRS